MCLCISQQSVLEVKVRELSIWHHRVLEVTHEETPKQQRRKGKRATLLKQQSKTNTD